MLTSQHSPADVDLTDAKADNMPLSMLRLEENYDVEDQKAAVNLYVVHPALSAADQASATAGGDGVGRVPNMPSIMPSQQEDNHFEEQKTTDDASVPRSATSLAEYATITPGAHINVPVANHPIQQHHRHEKPRNPNTSTCPNIFEPLSVYDTKTHEPYGNKIPIELLACLDVLCTHNIQEFSTVDRQAIHLNLVPRIVRTKISSAKALRRRGPGWWMIHSVMTYEALILRNKARAIGLNIDGV